MTAAPIHVMQVVHSLAQGGSESLARDLAMSFDSSRVCSSVCALDHGGPLQLDLANRSIRFHVLDRKAGFDWRLVPRLYRLFRRERVDVVQTHHLTQLIYGSLAARIADTLGDPERAIEMGRAARRAIEREFSLSHTVEKYSALYEAAFPRRQPAIAAA